MANATLQLRRGLSGDVVSITPAQGEPIYLTDTKALVIGDGVTAGGNAISGSGDAEGKLDGENTLASDGSFLTLTRGDYTLKLEVAGDTFKFTPADDGSGKAVLSIDLGDNTWLVDALKATSLKVGSNDVWHGGNLKIDLTGIADGQALLWDESTSQFVASTVGGSGDMLKSVYDTNNSGVVDKASAIDGVDEAGTSKYYGTNASGTPGLFDLPSGGSGGGPATISVVNEPGATWSAAPTDGSHYLVKLDQNTTISWTTTPSSTSSGVFKLWVERNGHSINWPSGTILASNVDLTGSAGTRELLLVEFYQDATIGTVWFVQQYGAWQLGSTESELPTTNLVHSYTFQTDFADGTGNADFSAMNGASIISSGKHGVSFTAANQQGLTLDQSFFDVTGDWTVFVGFNPMRTGGNQAILKFGPGNGYIYMYLAPNLGTPKFRILNKDASGTYGDTMNFDIADLPPAEQVWMLRKTGTTLTARCLTKTSLSATATMTSGDYDSSVVSVGYDPNLGHYYDGGSSKPIYGILAYADDITDENTIDAVRQYFINTLGLTNA